MHSCWTRFSFEVSRKQAFDYELVPKLIGVNGSNMKCISDACGGAKCTKLRVLQFDACIELTDAPVTESGRGLSVVASEKDS